MDIKKQNETIVSDPVVSGLDADIETGREDSEKVKGKDKAKPGKKSTAEEIEKKIKEESQKAQTITNAENRTFIDKEDQY